MTSSAASTRDRVITVHSNQTGEEKDETVQQLLSVEDPANPTEIVIHVNMLKEGWDVTNLYTIVPLRAANSKNAGRAVHRPRPAPAVWQAHRRSRRGPADHRLARPLSGDH